MAEKSSFMGKKSSFKGKNRVLSFLVKSSFPQNAQKSLRLNNNWFYKLSDYHFWKPDVVLQTFLPFFRANDRYVQRSDVRRPRADHSWQRVGH